MRDIRVHVPGPLVAGASLALPEQAAAHVARVLRLGAGDALTLFDGRGGEWTARIASVQGHRVFVTPEAHLAVERESPLAATLLQALARGEKMDWVLQKAAELGVARILPVATERSVVQLDGERAGKRLAHWQGILAAACEQCGRNRLPELLPPARLEAACAATSAATRLVLAPGAAASLVATVRSMAEGAGTAGMSIGMGRDAGAGTREDAGSGASRLAASAGASTSADGDDAGGLATHDGIALLIGPEGGLSESELRTALAHGFVAVGLGPRVLRTETAAIAALGLLQGLAGDLAGG